MKFSIQISRCSKKVIFNHSVIVLTIPQCLVSLQAWATQEYAWEVSIFTHE